MSAEDFFAGSGGDRNSASAAFKSIGDIVKGTIAEEPVLVDQTEFGSREVKLDKSGKPLKQLVVTLQTDRRNWDGAINPAKDESGNPKPAAADTGLRTLFVKFKLRDAIGDALKKANAKLEVGGELAVAYTSDTTFNGFKVKEYQAQYKPPVAAASGSFFSSDEAPF